MEYCGPIWDSTVRGEQDMLENVQRRSACWARGARGIISVTALLKDLNWLPLADLRRNQRLSLFYKIINRELKVPKESVDLSISTSRTRKHHTRTLERVSGRDSNSPFWKGTIIQTIPEGNRLSETTVTAGSFTTFKSQLNAAP